MTSVIVDSTANRASQTEIFYPSSDGEPLAESYDHLYVIMTTLAMLLAHLKGQQATVLADQFLYYAQGFPRLRVAPDVMVIYNVEPGGRDNYKIWEEGQVPSVIFEMTSPGTRSKDDVEKNICMRAWGWLNIGNSIHAANGFPNSYADIGFKEMRNQFMSR